MIVDTTAKLDAWRERVERVANASDDGETADFLLKLMDEVETLTRLVTVVQAQRMFDRFHAFDAIKDDKCPACMARVRVDETDMPRIRIISEDEAQRR